MNHARTKVQQWMVYVCWLGSCVGFSLCHSASVSCRILFQLNLFPPRNHLMIPLWALPYRLNTALKTTSEHSSLEIVTVYMINIYDFMEMGRNVVKMHLITFYRCRHWKECLNIEYGKTFRLDLIGLYNIRINHGVRCMIIFQAL